MRGGSSGLNMSTLLATPAVDPVYFISDFENTTTTTTTTTTNNNNTNINCKSIITKQQHEYNNNKFINSNSTSSSSKRIKSSSPITTPTPKSILQEIQNNSSSIQIIQDKHDQDEPKQQQYNDIYETIPIVTYLASVFFIFCLGIVAFLNELLKIRVRKEKRREGYISLYNWFDKFYQNHLIRRVWSAMFTPINSSPGPILTIVERESENQGWDIKFTTKTRDCINLGSYNYLNLANCKSPCVPKAIDTLNQYGTGHCTNRCEIGTTTCHQKLEKELAHFIGVEDALTFGMGFATNSLNIPSLMNSQTLVLSDQFNHSSIILGIKMSKAKIVVFQHNDMTDLEIKIRKEIIKANFVGNPWKKIFIVVEGVYSMHGSMAKLDDIIKIKEKYGAYLYLDEAHCMGAIGTNGKGLTQYFKIDPNKVDILMGTFAKSFGAIGGYIAGTKKLIDLLRKRSNAHYYGTTMPSVVATFILEGINFLSKDLQGSLRVQNLSRNTRYFRLKMQQMGYIISGDEDSPVVPVTVPVGTLRYVVDFMRERNIAAVMVGYPASPLTEGRIRCCMNALHTKEMIDYVLDCFQELSEHYDLRMSCIPRNTKYIKY